MSPENNLIIETIAHSPADDNIQFTVPIVTAESVGDGRENSINITKLHIEEL